MKGNRPRVESESVPVVLNTEFTTCVNMVAASDTVLELQRASVLHAVGVTLSIASRRAEEIAYSIRTASMPLPRLPEQVRRAEASIGEAKTL